MGLFHEPIKLDLPGADISYFPSFLTDNDASILFEHLSTKTPWKQDEITLFGKTHPQPRLTALYANNQNSYSYSGITMNPHAFSVELKQLKQAVERACQTTFTSCLLNYYRNGKDSNGWHSDDEKELGENPIIASVSLGAERFFNLRHKTDKTLKHKLLLEHGSLLLMQGATQHNWQHQVPKTSKKIGGRINLTFRVII
ncbi:alpha-ketoglutarate-dependent dioxygenase AlkB [Muricauda sp. 2012CJ35-5]|uniref:Alpha-ketoglutarate-dependent dioxygenase AlkB n=1 Tax=Flagellimonas spongiicola TaxID=2942208 RepID=A0ABT0PW89_9FLAO|nr:alpha-ketoglutarate-dependent dioxygenase AlkB [Allomuricauda spongiicola]MCL6275658.1 alpha-ketoglutarate-dependent dioxygenase AlkB [Allomuricauda spongiicola]